MIDFNVCQDYLGLSLLAGLLLLAVPGVRRLPLLGRILLIVLGLITVWVPLFQGQPLLFYVRGVVAGISVPTQVLMALWLARSFGGRSAYTQPLSRDVAGLMAGMFGLLFLCTLGYIPHDMYAWGYQARGLLVAAAALLAWSWWRHPGLAVAWLAGLTAYALNFGSSINLWDALGDPVLFLGAMWRFVFGSRTFVNSSFTSINLPVNAPRQAA